MSCENKIDDRKQSEAYVEYLNVVAKRKILKIEELWDGTRIFQILAKMRYFGDDSKFVLVQETSTIVDQMRNLKMIIKAIEQFWLRQVKEQVHIEIDGLKVVKDRNIMEIRKLVSLVIKTLFNSQQKEWFIEKVLQTSEQTQEFFMRLIQQEHQRKRDSDKQIVGKSVYGKLLQLEQQNQHLLKLLDEVCREKQDWSQREKQIEERLDEKQDQIKKLNWQINEFIAKRNEKTETLLSLQSTELKEARGQNQMLRQKINILQARLNELEMVSEKQLAVRADYEQKIHDLQSQRTTRQIEINEIQNDRDQKNRKLQSAFNQIALIQSKLESSLEELQEKSKTIQQLNSLIKKNETQTQAKTLLIEQLESTITYLASTQQNAQSSPEGKTRSSIKQECKQLVSSNNNNDSKLIIGLKRQIVALRQELSQCHQIIEAGQVQKARLKTLQEENNKLVQMISHMHHYRGQQNEILVKSVYRLRLELLKRQMDTSSVQSRTMEQTLNPLQPINRFY